MNSPHVLESWKLPSGQLEVCFDLVVKNIRDVLWLVDPDLNVLWVSPRAENVFGYTQEEIKNLPLERQITPQSMTELKEAIAQEFSPEKLAQKGLDISTTLKIEYLTKDGGTTWMETTFSLLRDGQGNQEGFLGVSHENHALKQRQERITHLNAVLSSIRSVNQLVVEEKDRDRLLQGACARLVEMRGFYNAWIVLLDESSSFITAAQSGLGENFADLVEQFERGELNTCARKALASSGVVVTPDPPADCPDCPLSTTYTGRAGLTARLEYDDHVYGLISASVPVEYASDEEEQSLFQEIANDLASGLNKLLLESRFEEQLADLTLINNLNQAVNRGDTLQDILGLLAQDTHRIFQGNGAIVYLLSEDGKQLVMQNHHLAPSVEQHIENLSSNRIPQVSLPLVPGSQYLDILQSGQPRLIDDSDTIRQLVLEFSQADSLPQSVRNTILKIVPQIEEVSGVRSVLQVPLISEGRPIGLVEISRDEQFTKTDLDRLVIIAGELTSIIRRKRVESKEKAAIEALRESEERGRVMLQAILTPEGDVGSLELADIIDVPSIQAILEEFYQITGLGAALLNLKGEVLASTGWQDICYKFHRVHPETCAYCHESDAQLSEGIAPGSFKIYRCKNNMWDVATPITLNEKHVGNLFTGQFFFSDEEVDYELFRAQARRYGFNENEYMAALDNVPRFDRDKIAHAMRFYARLGDLISNLNYSNVKLARTLTQRRQAETALIESERALQKAQKVAHLGNWAWHIQENRMDWSDEMYRIFGVVKEDTNNDLLELVLRTIHPEDRADAEEARDSIINDKRPVSLESRVVLPDGTERVIWAETGDLILDEAGNPSLITGIVQDITRRKKTETELMALSLRLETILTAAPDIIMEVDENKVYTWANQAGLDFFGEDVIGKEASYYFEDEQDTYQLVQPLFNGGESVFYVESWQRRQDGQKRLLAWWCRGLTDESGSVTGALSTARDITLSQRAKKELRQHATRLEALRQVSLELTQELDLDTLLRSIVERAMTLIDGRWGSFELFRPDLDLLVPTTVAGYGPDLTAPPLRLGEGLSGRVLESRKPILMDDYQNWEGRARVFNSHSLRAVVGVPVCWGDEFLGVLSVEAETPGAFSQADVELLSLFAAHAAIAIHNARLYDEAQRRNRELTLLNRIINASAARQAIEPILEVVCREMANYFGAPQAAAALLNTQKTQAFVVAEFRTGDHTSGLNEVIQVADNPSMEYLLRHKMPLAVEDAQNDPRLAPVHDLMQRRGTISLLLVPLLIDDEVAGSLGVDMVEFHSFTADEIGLARRVAEQVSGALARARLQDQFRQAQKMEAVGQLAAGIAHDFNNLLTTIIGYAELLQMQPGMPLEPALTRIVEQGQRAAQLTRQILDFSRKSMRQPRSLDLEAYLRESVQFIARTMPERVQIDLEVESGSYFVTADPTQLQQIVTNLAINARDAMPDGGRLTFRLARRSFTALDDLPAPDIIPGDWIVLQVSDTGMGIPPDVLPHIFEPFFTTKEVGQGSGLGLAQVFGIVKQHQGEIVVDSQVGVGSRFSIYLPASLGVSEAEMLPASSTLPSGRGETILLVEDDRDVRDVINATLEKLHYRVLTASNGNEALEVYRNHRDQVDIVLTDAVMPHMDGIALLRALRSETPDIKVMVVSGYAKGDRLTPEDTQNIVSWLDKPPDLMKLAQALRAALD